MARAKIEFYWRNDAATAGEHVVNWRLVGGNGEIMCQSTQGFRNKADAVRSVEAVTSALFGRATATGLETPKHVGPGRKPK